MLLGINPLKTSKLNSTVTGKYLRGNGYFSNPAISFGTIDYLSSMVQNKPKSDPIQKWVDDLKRNVKCISIQADFCLGVDNQKLDQLICEAKRNLNGKTAPYLLPLLINPNGTLQYFAVEVFYDNNYMSEYSKEIVKFLESHIKSRNADVRFSALLSLKRLMNDILIDDYTEEVINILKKISKGEHLPIKQFDMAVKFHKEQNKETDFPEVLRYLRKMRSLLKDQAKNDIGLAKEILDNIRDRKERKCRANALG